MPHEAGYIYAITSEGLPYVKIGSTARPMTQRLAQLQSGHPFRLTLVATVYVHDMLAIERQLHALLAAQRTYGEWYAVEMDAPTLEALVSQAYTTREVQRPRNPSTRPVMLTAVVDADLLAALDRKTAELQTQMPGIRMDRSTTVRYLLRTSLAADQVPAPPAAPRPRRPTRKAVGDAA